MNNIKIKIIIQNEMRKFKFDKKSQSYDDFLTKIYQLWKNKYPETETETYATLVTKYLDADEDWITFSSEEEWKEVLEDMKGKNTIKVKVEAKSKGRKFCSPNKAMGNQQEMLEGFLKNLSKSNDGNCNFLQQLLGSFMFPAGGFQGFQGNNKCGSSSSMGGVKCNSFDDLLKNLFTNLQCNGGRNTGSSCPMKKTSTQRQQQQQQGKKNVSKENSTKGKTKKEQKKEKTEGKTFKNFNNFSFRGNHNNKNNTHQQEGQVNNLGNLIQSFLPMVNNAFQSYHQQNGGSPHKARPLKDYKKEREQLKSMGFLDDKKNLELLRKWSGNIKRVVAEYFQ